MRVLVTRPLPDAETTAEHLRSRGHDPVLAPMLTTKFVDWADVAPLGARPDAIAATSLNGIRGLANHPAIDVLADLPLFVVGNASAQQARDLGFSDVRAAEGGFGDVVKRLKAEVTPGSRVLYAAGHDRSGDLVGKLAAGGIQVDLIEVYRAIAADRLPETVTQTLKTGNIDRILIFSARTADALATCLRADRLLAVSRTIPIHAISRQAAEPLIASGFHSIIVSPRPDAAELLDTLGWAR